MLKFPKFKSRLVNKKNLLTVDHFRDSIAAINKVIADKRIKLVRFTELSLMDDETYGAADELKPLPKC